MSSSGASVRVNVEFVGGLDIVFGGVSKTQIELPGGEAGRRPTVLDVMVHCRDHLLTERPELFMKGNSVRPGVLVLVDEADWELHGGTEAEVQDQSKVVFISTLHGG